MNRDALPFGARRGMQHPTVARQPIHARDHELSGIAYLWAPGEGVWWAVERPYGRTWRWNPATSRWDLSGRRVRAVVDNLLRHGKLVPSVRPLQMPQPATAGRGPGRPDTR